MDTALLFYVQNLVHGDHMTLQVLLPSELSTARDASELWSYAALELKVAIQASSMLIHPVAPRTSE